MTAEPLKQDIESILPEVTELRHDLHRHPELGYEEKRTGQRVLAFLEGTPGLEIQTGLAGTGFTVTIGRDLPGPCLGLRADMDALPIEEESGVEWTSTVPGKMHACGHDGHTAMLAGAIRLLAARTDQLPGPVKCIFQPAEEGGGGGRRMCEEGALENPGVDAVFGLHNNLPYPNLPAGRIAYCSGPAMAGTGTFDIEVIGQGGHAAFPHQCVDPIYIASCIVTELQGVVARSINPVQPAVLSVTRFHAGTAFNIIPGKATLNGTIRALDTGVLEQLRDGLVKRASEVASAHGARAQVRCDLGYPVLVNNDRMEGIFLQIMEEAGFSGRVDKVGPVMGGEDFAFYALKVPAFFYYLPACPEGVTSNPSCHDSTFDFNDSLLPLGMRLHVESALRFGRLWQA